MVYPQTNVVSGHAEAQTHTTGPTVQIQDNRF